MRKESAKKGNGGQGIGTILHFSKFVSPEKRITTDVREEHIRFEEAMRKANESYKEKQAIMQQKDDSKAADIIEAQQMMLNDDSFRKAVIACVDAEHFAAPYAVFTAGEAFAAELEHSDSEYLRARSADIRAVSRKLIDILQGTDTEVYVTEDSVIYADDLSPEELLSVDKKYIKAIITNKGSAVSHTAILAGTYGVPYLFGVNADVIPKTGTAVIVDGDAGIMIIDPDEETKKAYEKVIRESEENMKEGDDNLPVKLYANIAGPDDLELVVKYGAQGIGLFRTEFLFMNRATLPTEDEQYEIYKQVVQAMQNREVIIRTMDIGTDKKTECLPMPDEENPALGKRALRICLDDTELFRTQLRALLRAAKYGILKIMYPMIASAWEINEANNQLKIAAQELASRNEEYKIPECGIMIETPAAAMCSDELAGMVDFFSIGTNDLTQYTLAADRRGVGMERYFNIRHEAVFRLIEMTAANAHKHGITVGICGELGGDPDSISRLVAAGIDELSMSPGRIPLARKAIKEYMDSISIKETCEEVEVTESLTSPADGYLVPMSEIPDEAFSSGAMGQCIAVEPDNGMIYAPCSGKVIMIAARGHAIAIQSDRGKRVLIHAGIDTVKLNGTGFDVKISEGCRVEQGELILIEDIDYIKSQGLSPMVILLDISSDSGIASKI